MATEDDKSSKPSSSRAGEIRALPDLNLQPSDFDSPQEHHTGGENSGMPILDPSDGDDLVPTFNQARLMGVVERPISHLHSSSTGTGRLLTGETVLPAHIQLHTIMIWRNGFSVDCGPFRPLDDPEHASFMECINRQEWPRIASPDWSSPFSVILVRWNKEYGELDIEHVPFRVTLVQHAGRTEGSSSASQLATERSITPTGGMNESMQSTLIILLADGTSMDVRFNNQQTISDMRALIDQRRPGSARNYQLHLIAVLSKHLSDEAQTIGQTVGLTKFVVFQIFSDKFS